MDKTISQLTIEAWQTAQDDEIDSLILAKYYEENPSAQRIYQSVPQCRPAILLLAYRDAWIDAANALKKAERIINSMN